MCTSPSAVRSRPYRWGTKRERDWTTTERKYNRPPTKKELLAHAPVLDYELANIRPKLIVTLGNVGLQRLLGKEAKVKRLHGQLLERPVQYLNELEDTTFNWTRETYRIVPTFHPASIFYRPSHRPSLDADWLEIGRILGRWADDNNQELEYSIDGRGIVHAYPKLGIKKDM